MTEKLSSHKTCKSLFTTLATTRTANVAYFMYSSNKHCGSTVSNTSLGTSLKYGSEELHSFQTGALSLWRRRRSLQGSSSSCQSITTVHVTSSIKLYQIIAHQTIQILSRTYLTIIFIVLLTRIRLQTAREAHRRRKRLYRFEAVRTLEIYRRHRKPSRIKINLTPVRCGSKYHIQQYK
jgi:hypothetical protein